LKIAVAILNCLPAYMPFLLHAAVSLLRLQESQKAASIFDR